MIQMFLWKFLRNSPFVLKPQSLLLQLSQAPIKRKLKENAAASSSISAWNFFSGLRGCSEIVWILPEFFWMTFAKIPGLSPICRKLPLRTLLPLVDPLQRDCCLWLIHWNDCWMIHWNKERGTKVKFHFEARVGKIHKKLASLKTVSLKSNKQARKPRSYASPKLRPTHSLTHLLTGVTCRATSVAKNQMITFSMNKWPSHKSK